MQLESRRASWVSRICAAATLLIASTGALAHPALWVARSPTATVYMFGTVHALPDGLKWHYPALDKALSASSKLYVEEDDDSFLNMQLLILEYGMNWQGSLSDQLDAKDQTRLAAAAKAVGINGGAATLNMMQPWLAALTITGLPVIKAGYDPKSGADKQLEREFKAEGKPIGAFETAEEQIKFFADLPAPLQLDFLRSALDDYANGPALIKAMVGLWEAGDVPAIATSVSGKMGKHYPDLYNVLLVNRNRNWAKQIAGLLKQHTTIFVAVGAGHLAGPDSLLLQLRKLGIRSERVH